MRSYRSSIRAKGTCKATTFALKSRRDSGSLLEEGDEDVGDGKEEGRTLDEEVRLQKVMQHNFL